jgi:hypothetical protein
MAEALGCYAEYVEEPEAIRPALQRAWKKVEEGMVGFVNVKTDYRAPRHDRAFFEPRDLSGRARVTKGVPPGTRLSEGGYGDARPRRCSQAPAAPVSAPYLIVLLNELGELGNTIFIFSSDNGDTSSAGPAGVLHFNRCYAGLPALPVELDVERAAWGQRRAGLGRLSDDSTAARVGWDRMSLRGASMCRRSRLPPGIPGNIGSQ